MVKWVCQIVTPVRHRALISDVRLFAGNTADDTLVTGGIFRFCRLMCLCVKRRNIILNSKRRSLLNSTLFRADNHTRQKAISPFSLALIFTFDFAALSERRSCPEDRSRRFVPVGTLTHCCCGPGDAFPGEYKLWRWVFTFRGAEGGQ